MSVLRKLRRLRRRLLRNKPSVPSNSAVADLSRICRFEQVEQRQLLSVAPIQIGAVYFEDNVGADEAGDLFDITWTGGAPGTQLTQIVIETDKAGDGLTPIDAFFDTADGGLGTSGWAGLAVLDHAGFSVDEISLVDGGTTLVMTFSGFEAGERLRFSVDVDELASSSASAVTEGAEFEDSFLMAEFVADHYHPASDWALFRDDYVLPAELDLPADDYMPPGSQPAPVQTAAVVFSLTQPPLPISVAGTVFEDIDLDNVRDPGEPGLAGVSVELLRLDGADYVASGMVEVTDANGAYRFDQVLPGVYRIAETQPNGYLSIGATAGTVAGLTRGVVTGADEISQLELLGGEDSLDNDFAEARFGSLSGFVYHDADNNGLFDAGEVGIGGATVAVQYLPTAGPPPPPVIVQTAADGSWSADQLWPGDYRLEEVTPHGYLDGLDSAGSLGGLVNNPGDSITNIRILSRESGQDYNFGELLPGTISGRVVAQRDDNCDFDPGDDLLAGVTVNLRDEAGNLLETTLTNSQGRYEFVGLIPGVYTVEEIQPDGYFDGDDHIGSVGGTLLPTDSIAGVPIVSGAKAVDYDFCELIPGRISGRVGVDANGNQILDPNESALGGVTIRLLDELRNLLAATTTDADGRYEFNDLLPGRYHVREEQPKGYFDGSDQVGSSGGVLTPPDEISAIVLLSGADAVDYDFLELEPVGLSGYVYVDANQSGQFDPGEQGIANVTLRLLDQAGNETGQTTTTDGKGFYRFDGLQPWSIVGVAETQPDGYHDGLDSVGSAGGLAHNPGDSITSAKLLVGVHAVNYNFGELLPASISGRVHGELNGDCLPDEGEPLLAGVTIYLLNESGQRIQQTTTDAAGQYLFENLVPGVYGVEEIQPDGYLQGTNHVGQPGGELGGLDQIIKAKLGSGVKGVNYNFCETVPAGISGYVFQDGPTIKYNQGDTPPDPAQLRDGKFTSDDTPIAGVTLTLGDGSGVPLTDSQGNLITAVTDANGYYQFKDLLPGVYTVLQSHPDGFTDGIDTAGTNGGVAVNPSDNIDPALINLLVIDPRDDAIINIGLGMGDQATQYNFSEVRLQEVPPWVPPKRPPEDPVPKPRFSPGSPPPRLAGYVAGLDQTLVTPFWGGGGGFYDFAWHLSVINAGQPRRAGAGDESLHWPTSYSSNPWTRTDMDQSSWVLTDGEMSQAIREYLFGFEDAIPLVGDFNGDGVDEIAVYHEGQWFIDLNGNGIWDEGDFWAQLGNPDDLPVVGDWDGDGKTDIGVYGPPWDGDAEALKNEPGLPDAANRVRGVPKNLPPEQAAQYRVMQQSAQGAMRTDVVDHVFQFGSRRDIPLSGDFNGDGVTNIGLFRDGTWMLDTDGDGRLTDTDQRIEGLGSAGDLPVVGDFNGDGVDELGVYRQGTWRLDTNNNLMFDATDEVFALGGPNDLPVVGDFNGDGVDEAGLYRGDGGDQTVDASSVPGRTRQ